MVQPFLDEASGTMFQIAAMQGCQIREKSNASDVPQVGQGLG